LRVNAITIHREYVERESLVRDASALPQSLFAVAVRDWLSPAAAATALRVTSLTGRWPDGRQVAVDRN